NIEAGGEVHVEGEFVGRIEGLNFKPDAASAATELQALKVASLAAITTEILARAKSLAATPDTELKLTRLGEITWNGHAVGSVRLGDHILRPQAEVLAEDVLQAAARDEVKERLQKFVQRHIATTLEPLLKLEDAEGFEPQARGMAFRLVEAFGVLPREHVIEEVKALSQDDRAKLRTLGARFGAFHIFLPALLKPAATELRLLLWWLQHHKGETAIPTPPANGLTSTAADVNLPEGFYRICGYRLCGRRAVRVDMVERLSDLIRDRVFWKPRIETEQRPAGSIEGGGFTVVPDMMSLVGCSGEEFDEILLSLGFKAQKRQMPKPVHLLAASVPAPEVPVAEPTAEPAAEAPVESVPLAETAPVPEPEMVEVNIWWPKDTGPFRHQHEKPKHHHRPERDKSERPKQDRPKRDHKPKFERREKSAAQAPRPPRPEKPIDPNSPFAKLAALKELMKGN
ncbi:MAG: hypothetical protein ABJA10_00995, partial [Aestuariivirga sp.]